MLSVFLRLHKVKASILRHVLVGGLLEELGSEILLSLRYDESFRLNHHLLAGFRTLLSTKWKDLGSIIDKWRLWTTNLWRRNEFSGVVTISLALLDLVVSSTRHHQGIALHNYIKYKNINMEALEANMCLTRLESSNSSRWRQMKALIAKSISFN